MQAADACFHAWAVSARLLVAALAAAIVTSRENVSNTDDPRIARIARTGAGAVEARFASAGTLTIAKARPHAPHCDCVASPNASFGLGFDPHPPSAAESETATTTPIVPTVRRIALIVCGYEAVTLDP
jgi:hypothetical protein